MKILFTKSTSYYSKIARWLFDEPCDHVALLFYPESFNLVVEGTKPVCRLTAYNSFISSHNIVHDVHIQTNCNQEYNLYKKIINTQVGLPYNWDAYFYGLVAGLKLKLLDISLPTTNLYQSEGQQLCTTILRPIIPDLKRLGLNLDGVDLYSLTPHMLFKLISESINND
jgi:hypothetical protein